MIEAYFTEIEVTIQAFPHIDSYWLNKKIYNNSLGYIRGSIIFENRYRLDFIEMKQVGTPDKIKYRYQYMDERNTTIFRYDNAPHHKNIHTFPHHKHTDAGIVACSEPALNEVLFEIAQAIHHDEE